MLMPLAGRKLTIEEALALCRTRGFTRDRLITAVAVMTAESGRYVEAWAINAKVEPDGTITKSVDRGLFQINTLHVARLGWRDSFSAVPNARFAWKLSRRGTDFTPWFAFVNNKHLQFVDEIRAVFEADAWRVLIPVIQEELE